MNLKLKQLRNDSRGAITTWITVLAGIFVVAVVFIPLDDIVRHDLYDIGITLGCSSNLLDRIIAAWTAFPIIFLIGLFIYGIVRGQKQEFDTGGF